jgi:general secretion pathway protein N
VIRRWIFVRDGRLTGATKLALAALFVAALIAVLPMRLALAWGAPDQISARSVEGTIWSAGIYDLRLGALPLGDVAANLRILPLFVGRREIHVERPGPTGSPEFSANGSGGRGWAHLSDVNGQVPLGDGFGTIPATALGFDGFHVSMASGRCREAGGRVSLILSPFSELMPGPVALSGTARCHRNALYVPMTGPTGMERLFLRLEPDGRWRADLVLAGLPVEITAPLLDAGFSARPGGIGMSATGRL